MLEACARPAARAASSGAKGLTGAQRLPEEGGRVIIRNQARRNGRAPDSVHTTAGRRFPSTLRITVRKSCAATIFCGLPRFARSGLKRPRNGG